MGMERVSIEISWQSIWRVVAVAALVYGAFLMQDTIAILLLALIISTAIDPAVDKMEEWRIPRILGTILVFLIGFSILAVFLYTIVPITLLELNSLFKELDGLTNQFLGLSSPFEVINIIDSDLSNFSTLLLSGKVPFLEILGRLLGGVALVVAVLVLSFYLTLSRSGVEKFLRSILPDSLEKTSLRLYRNTRKKIGRWFQAQLFLSFVIGTAVFIGLSILGIKQSLVLAMIAAVLELVPVVGPIFAGALAVVVAVGENPQLGLYVLLLFLAIQQLENQILVPLVMRKAIGINPVMILVALLGGAQVAGIIGMLIAIPAAVFAQEVINAWVDKKAEIRNRKLEV